MRNGAGCDAAGHAGEVFESGRLGKTFYWSVPEINTFSFCDRCCGGNLEFGGKGYSDAGRNCGSGDRFLYTSQYLSLAAEGVGVSCMR